MKHKTLFAFTLLFFVLINTTHLWQERLGILAMPAAVALFIFYLFLIFVLAQQLYLLTKEKFSDWQRIAGTALLVFVIVLTYLNPTGLVDFSKTSVKELLVAYTGSKGDCTTTMVLYINNTFTERNECFGTTEVKGKFEVYNDTVFFKEAHMEGFENSYYQYAVIKAADIKKKKGPTLIRFYNALDKEGQPLSIVKNNIPPVKR